MTEATLVTLVRATRADSSVLENLLELYLHDMSEAFPIELGANGRFEYQRLEQYWAEPDARFAFLIRCDGGLVGFALVTRGSPVAEDPEVLDVAEFFVIRRFRRAGVGARAAHLLWQALPGAWTVRASEGVVGAVPFWARAVAGFSACATESTHAGSLHAWRVFSFRSEPAVSVR